MSKTKQGTPMKTQTQVPGNGKVKEEDLSPQEKKELALKSIEILFQYSRKAPLSAEQHENATHVAQFVANFIREH